jgi:hypothetical protein
MHTTLNCGNCGYFERPKIDELGHMIGLALCLKKNREAYPLEKKYGCSAWQNASASNIRRIRTAIKPVLRLVGVVK